MQEWAAAIAIISVGLLTIFSMLKIWSAAFWGEASTKTNAPAKTLLATSGLLAVVTLLIGLASGPFFQLASDAAQTLLEPSAYIRAVLGPTNPTMP